MFPISESLLLKTQVRKAQLRNLALEKVGEAKRRLPEWLKRDRVPDAFYADARARLESWLADKRPEDINLVLDGPGYGCTFAYCLIGLLGDERMAKLPAVHAFSASSYVLMCWLAARRNQLIWPIDELDRWNLENIRRHDVKPGLTLAKAVYSMVRRKESLWSSDLCEQALAVTVTPEFQNTRVAELPENLHFWTYNITKQRFESIDARGELRNLTLGQVCRAVAGIPGLYEPFSYRGSQYIDPLWAPGVREKFKELRGQAPHCLFGHMQRNGLHGNTLFVRLHPDTSSYRRLGVDFAYFMLGLDNPQTMNDYRRGLWETEAIPLTKRE